MLLRKIGLGLKALLQREQQGQELNAELQSFLESVAQEKVRAGMAREPALRAARLEMGSMAAIHDGVSDAGWESIMESAWRDLRYAFRILRRNLAFTAIAVATLALGMGVCTTVFAWIDEVLVHPIPGLAKGAPVVVFENLTPDGQPVTTSYPDFRDYRDHLSTLAGLAVARYTDLSVGEPDSAERVSGQYVSGNYFAVLGVRPALGRVFSQDEYGDKPRAYPIAVISDRFWRSHFNSDPAVIGKAVKINQHEFTIIGVTPPAFHGSMAGQAYEVWIPCTMRPLLSGFKTDWQLTDRKNRDLFGIARLKPGVTLQQSQTEIAALAAQLGKLYPMENGGMSATVLPLWKAHFGPQGQLVAPLEILAGVCVVLLLIVCANVANLLLARMATRQGEFGMRLALGARRWRLARQLLTESLLLAGISTALGVVSSIWMARAVRYLLPSGENLAFDARVNPSVLLFALLMCVLTTLLCGIVPVVQSLRLNLADRLKENARSATGGQSSQRVRRLLVFSEMSLAMLALISGGLFTRSFLRLEKLNAGFDPENVMVTQFALSTAGFDLHQRQEFCIRLREKLESQPGVRAVSYSDNVPLGPEHWWEDLEVKGYQARPGENMKMFRYVVARGYFKLLGISIVAGRDFTEADDDSAQAPAVMIVNESFARRFFGNQIAIGRQVHGWGDWFTVVGVARDSKYNSLSEHSVPFIYVPFRQVYRNDMFLSFYIKTQKAPEEAAAMLRRVVRDTDPRVTVFDSSPLTEYIGTSIYPQKLTATFLFGLGLLGLLLAAVGLYSVIAYSVAQRTHEIGLRMALGAHSLDVIRAILRQGMTVTLLGILAGAFLALLILPGIAGLSFSIGAMGTGNTLLSTGTRDPAIYFGAALFLSAIAALACYVPALRAIRVDPLVALRHE